jgi:phosphatidylglycerophosphatase A
MTNAPRPNPKLLLSSPAAWLALGFGTGLSPAAPGTVGSLLGIPLALALQTLAVGWQIAIWVVLCGIGCWACGRTGRMLQVADHPAIVWDEVCGMAAVLLLAPSGWPWIVASFAAFRLFDIVKPWPVHLIDRRWQNGFGVMADDLMAAVYAIVVIRILSAIFGMLAA